MIHAFVFFQGLKDCEEFVVCKALHALTCLAELLLLQKPTLQDCVGDVVPFLCHPVSLFIRWYFCIFFRLYLNKLGYFSSSSCLNTFLLFCQNDWVRYAAAGFISTCARIMNIADIYCCLMPAVKRYLQQPIIDLQNEVRAHAISV